MSMSSGAFELANVAPHYDITLVGGGIMSATMGMLLHHVRPDASIAIVERLDSVGQESSSPWHNAGTGHAALCELHYTPRRPDGSIDTAKALQVNEQFQLSLQMYAWIVEQGMVEKPSSFINRVPHLGFCQGETDVQFLRDRHEALSSHSAFAGISFSDHADTIADWAPLLMRGRSSAAPVAVTRSEDGTDVNFGALTTILTTALVQRGADLFTGHQVTDLERPERRWKVSLKNRLTGDQKSFTSDFVFVGAGGTAVHLLQKSGIKEIKGIGGFPVSGQFLRCTDPELVALHDAKVYGRPATGAPPMTAPHLDTRVINGKRGLMFGPYAGFSPKFLKKGSYLDFIRSIRPDNILTMLSVARDEMPLTAYLVKQVLQSKDARIQELQKFYPEARPDSWDLIHAGQRVQVMRPTKAKRGILQFGTEVIAANDGTIAGLLGASPGASTTAAIMLNVMERCFPIDFADWLPRLQEIIPSLDANLSAEPALFEEIRSHSDRVLFDRSTATAVVT
jgi:malate dehydrogenase (quinone)